MQDLHSPTDKALNEIKKEVEEIKKEMKVLNQNLGMIAKMIKDYMVHQGVYMGPGGMFNNPNR